MIVVPSAADVAGDAARLRTVNAPPRELLDQKDAQIAALHARLADLDELRGQVTALQAQIADLDR